MEKLSNGAIVLEKKKLDDEAERVLCIYEHAMGNLVSWTRRLDSPDIVFWGHYYTSLEQAIHDWVKLNYSEYEQKEYAKRFIRELNIPMFGFYEDGYDTDKNENIIAFMDRWTLEDVETACELYYVELNPCLYSNVLEKLRYEDFESITWEVIANIAIKVKEEIEGV